MAEIGGPLAGAGTPRRPKPDFPTGRRIGAFLEWWVPLMALWVWVDDSIDLAELLVGAGVAVVGARLAEMALYQSNTHIRLRFEWLLEARKLPWEVFRDSGIVFSALWRTIVTGQQPASGFREIQMQWGDDTP